MQGNDYSCCCCDRLLFQNQVQRCERNTYAKNDQAANVAEMCIQDKYCHQCTNSCPENCIWSKLWICFTCHRKILTGTFVIFLQKQHLTKLHLKIFQMN